MSKRGRRRAPKTRSPLLEKFPTGAVASSVALSGVLVSSGTSAGLIAQSQPQLVVAAADNLEVDSQSARATATEYVAARSTYLSASASRSRNITALESQVAAAQAQLDDAALNGKKVISIADDYEGTKYRRGGTTPAGFDCSGFTKFVYGKLGITLPRVSHAQYKWADEISADEAQVGDLVFFHSSSGYVYHVGIVSGEGRMWDSPKPGQRVDERAIWSSRVSYGRVPDSALDRAAAAKLAEAIAALEDAKSADVPEVDYAQLAAN
jgi:cell wall-associated NlpC family hydrolase